jgi:hypothetical protein
VAVQEKLRSGSPGPFVRVVISHSFAFSANRRPSSVIKAFFFVQFGYLEVTVQEKLRSGWPGPFVKVEGCCGLSFVCIQCEQTSQVQF